MWFMIWIVSNLVPRAFPLKVGGAGPFPAPPTFKGKALGTRLDCVSTFLSAIGFFTRLPLNHTLH